MFCCRHFYRVRIEPHYKHRSIEFLTTQTDQSKGDILIDYVLKEFYQLAEASSLRYIFKFRRVRDDFQDKLKDDIKQINNSSKALTFADKTTNLYELDKTQYDKLLHQTVTKTYKKAKKSTSNIINEEAKGLATELPKKTSKITQLAD